MDLSIVIVSFNTKDYLKECLKSIFALKTSIEFEIIVVDNHSHDGSPEMVKCYYPEVNLIVSEENLGFSKGCNIGIIRSSGRYILLLNSDTLVLPEMFDRLIHFADKNSDGAIFGCTHLDGERKRAYSFAYGFVAPRIAMSKKPIYSLKGYVSGACMLIRRDFGEKHGWMDEQFFFCPEDIEICWRAVKTGWKVCFTPEAEIIHFGARSCGSGFNPLVYYEAKRGYGILMDKHGNFLQKSVGKLLMTIQVLGDFLVALISGSKGKKIIYRKVLNMYFKQDFSIPYLNFKENK